MVEYVFDIEEGATEPRPMAVHRAIHQSPLQLVVDGVYIEGGKTHVRFSRKLRSNELKLLDQLMAGPFQPRRRRRRERLPARAISPVPIALEGDMNQQDKQDIIDAVVMAVLASQRAIEQRLDDLQLSAGPEEPEHLLPIDESIADVDTAGKSAIEAAPEAEELVLTSDVVDTGMAGELARLKELKAKKEGDDE